MNVIILGAGQVGRTAVHHLAREEANEVTIIDLNDQVLRDLQDRLDIRTVVGNGAFPSVLEAAGAKKTWGGAIAPIPVSSHAYGGTRMGEDPGNSVVDRYSISHEAPNLAVMGASTFVSTSGFNPTETVEALAWYGADHIAKNFGTLAA